jgi:hypothetical protein
LGDMLQTAAQLKERGSPQFISGDAVVNSFDAVMNLSDLVCRNIDDKDFNDLHDAQAMNSRDKISICTNLPRMTEDFLAAIKKLAVAFCDPVAARRYSRNFRLLMKLNPNIIVKLNTQLPANNWSSLIEEQGSRAGSIYVSLTRFNSEMYRQDCVSFLMEEAAYYEKKGAHDKSLRVLNKIREIGQAAPTQAAAPSDSYDWIKYIN